MTDTNPLLPLSSNAFEILLALAKEDLHGYAIIQHVSERTKGSLKLHPGTLYRVLARFLDQGLVDEIDESPVADTSDERRRTYRMTERGRIVAAAETRRLADQVRAAKKLKLGESSR